MTNCVWDCNSRSLVMNLTESENVMGGLIGELAVQTPDYALARHRCKSPKLLCRPSLCGFESSVNLVKV